MRFNLSRRILLLIFMLGLAGQTVQAQAGQLPPMAAVTDRQLTLYNVGGGTRQIMRAELLPFDNIVWSADGQHLAFTAYGGGYSPMLMLTTRDGSAPVNLAGDVYILPATFSADGSQVIYAGQPGEAVESSTGLPTFALDVYTQGLSAGAPREVIGQIHFGTGCGGGSPYPMDAVYNIETGFGGSNIIFAMTASGLVYSLNCAGRGLALLNPESGERADLGGGLRGASLSADRTQVVALEGGSIMAIDLASGQRRSHMTQISPDQVAWGQDNNTVYYSARTLLDETLPLSEQEAQSFANFTGQVGFTIPQYNVSIRRVDLPSGQETPIYNGPGWAVGRMFVSGGSLYFSLVPNGETWVEAVAGGLLNLSSADSFFAERATVAVTMLRVPAGGGDAVEVGHDIGQAVLHPSAR